MVREEYSAAGNRPGGDTADIGTARADREEAEARHGVPGLPVRCGRSVQVVQHLVEADDAFRQRHWIQVITAVCGADLTEPTDWDWETCTGCQDCFRYCAECAREAAKFSEQPEQRAEVSIGQLRVPDLLLDRI